jgi:hypothetical protein
MPGQCVLQRFATSGLLEKLKSQTTWLSVMVVEQKEE